MEEERFNYSTNDATRFVDELKDRVHDLYDENKRLKERIDEAIEYIENNFVTYKEADSYRLDIDTDIKVMISNFAVLIDILRDSDKEC